MKKLMVFLFLMLATHLYAEDSDSTWETRVIYDEQTQLTSAKYTYINGELRIRCFYYYDEAGVLAVEVTDNGSSENPDDWTDVTERIVTTHHPDGTSSTEIYTSPGKIKEDEEKYTGYYLKQFFTSIKNFFTSRLKDGFARHDAMMLTLKEEGERILDFIIGPVAVRMIGNNTRPVLVGVHGPREINERVRITFTNGIMNAPSDHEENLVQLSRSHGHTNIHYVFRQFEGWNHDILRCAASKLGIVSKQAKLIAKQWKDLIESMGGPHSGGIIIHYAHSIGGTETNNAKTLMTRDELKMIHVITIGSATLIPNRDFASVINFVSKRDGVSQAADAFNYFLLGPFQSESNTFYIGTFVGWPFVDHPLTTDAYKTLIEILGKQFIEKYVNSKE